MARCTTRNTGPAAPHNPAWKPSTADILQRGRLCRLRGVDGRVVSRAGSGDRELLPHAKSYPPNSSAIIGGWTALGHRRGAPPLHAADQFLREVARLPMARAVRLLRDGRALLAGGARYIELNPVRAGLVADPRDWQWSSAGASCREGRPVGQSCSVACDDRRLACLPGERDARGGTGGHTPSHAYRSTLGRRNISRPSGRNGWPFTETPEARSKVETERELSYVYLEFPPGIPPAKKLHSRGSPTAKR